MTPKCPRCKRSDIIIVQYKWYDHYFNSATSSIRPCQSSVVSCQVCLHRWRTAAKYIEKLKEQGKVSDNEKRNILIVAKNRAKLLKGL